MRDISEYRSEIRGRIKTKEAIKRRRDRSILASLLVLPILVFVFIGIRATGNVRAVISDEYVPLSDDMLDSLHAYYQLKRNIPDEIYDPSHPAISIAELTPKQENERYFKRTYKSYGTIDGYVFFSATECITGGGTIKDEMVGTNTLPDYEYDGYIFKVIADTVGEAGLPYYFYKDGELIPLKTALESGLINAKDAYELYAHIRNESE